MSLVMKFVLAILLSVLLIAGSGFAPALAHGSVAHEHGHVDGVNAVDDKSNDADPSELPDTPSDSLHHHHCPAALGSDAPDLVGGIVTGNNSPASRPVTRLTSLSQAPPTQPPSA